MNVGAHGRSGVTSGLDNEERQSHASVIEHRALILLASPHPALADQQWHYQASAQVSPPGLIETVLPAGVFFGTDSAAKTSQLDLTLVGPDNNPRSFELFWKGDTGLRGRLAY